MSRTPAPAPYVPAAYRPGTPLAAKIARENAEANRRLRAEQARRSALYGSPQPNRGREAPSAPESVDAEEGKGKGKPKGENGPRRRRRPGEAPTLGPWQRVYGIVCPRCSAVSGELCHTSAGEFRSVWEPHRGREKHHLGKRSVGDRGVRPHFAAALAAWEDGMSAKAAGITNRLPGDEQQRQREQGAGTRQQQVRGVIGGGKQGKPKGRVQSASTSGSGAVGVLGAWLGSWVSAFKSAYADLGEAYEQGKRR
ncbi:hypothetical protein GCM10009648_04000 [Tsukamurella spumae]